MRDPRPAQIPLSVSNSHPPSGRLNQQIATAHSELHLTLLHPRLLGRFAYLPGVTTSACLSAKLMCEPSCRFLCAPAFTFGGPGCAAQHSCARDLVVLLPLFCQGQELPTGVRAGPSHSVHERIWRRFPGTCGCALASAHSQLPMLLPRILVQTPAGVSMCRVSLAGWLAGVYITQTPGRPFSVSHHLTIILLSPHNALGYVFHHPRDGYEFFDSFASTLSPLAFSIINNHRGIHLHDPEDPTAPATPAYRSRRERIPHHR